MTTYSPQWKETRDPAANAGRDIEYFQGLYPRRIKELQKYVARQCDIMDYAGSPIYDEYPDAVMIDRTCQVICQNLPGQWQESGQADAGPEGWAEEEQAELYEAGEPPAEIQQQSIGAETGALPGWELPLIPSNSRPPQGPPGGPGWGPPPGPRPPQNPPGGGWISDIVKVLLMNELQRRRCRSGLC